MPDETIYYNSSFIVYDMFGREVKRIDNINTNEIQINRVDMKSGIYYYRYMQGEDLISSDKFVIAE
ncbi:MAG: T9SS type A sorting domain-containing protein [Bacteroidetes bacterium]|nr:T9SS type A sorting domain-containing protein [Bacteroidota bacterium]